MTKEEIYRPVIIMEGFRPLIYFGGGGGGALSPLFYFWGAGPPFRAHNGSQFFGVHNK